MKLFAIALNAACRYPATIKGSHPKMRAKLLSIARCNDLRKAAERYSREQEELRALFESVTGDSNAAA